MGTSIQCPNCASKQTLDDQAHAVGRLIDCRKCDALIPLGTDGAVCRILAGISLKRFLGKGHRSAVYLGASQSLGRDVAVKILPADFFSETAAEARFQNATKRAAEVQQEHIVRTYDVDEDQGFHLLIVEHVDGEILPEIVGESGTLPEEAAVEMVLKLAKAMARVWDEHRMIHGHIEPARIMVNRAGEPKLMELGHAMEPDLAESSMHRSPNYLSPEHSLSASQLDLQADIYSLGATLYFLLTGQPPFRGRTVLEVLGHQATAALADPRSINPQISEGTVQLMTRMMAKLKDHRHPSWDALVADLQAVRAGERPTTPASTGNVSSRSKPKLAESTTDRKHSKKPLLPVVMIAVTVTAVMIGMFWPETDKKNAATPPEQSVVIHDGTNRIPASEPEPMNAVAVGMNNGNPAGVSLISTNKTEFGFHQQGEPVIRQQFQIRNSGDRSIKPDREDFSVAGSSDFSISRIPESIPVGKMASLEVSFEPRTLGRQNALVSIRTGGSSTRPFTFPVSGFVNPANLPAAAYANLTVDPADQPNANDTLSVTLADGTSDFGMADGGDTGRFNFRIGTDLTDDTARGILIASVGQNGVNRPQFEGRQHATVSVYANPAGNFGLAVSQTIVQKAMNIDCAAVFFPFAEGWLAGHAMVSENDGRLSSFSGNSRLKLNPTFGEHGFTRLDEGRYSLHLPGVRSRDDGVLLVNHGADGPKFAQSMAMPDGSWTIFVHDNAANGIVFEDGSIAFAFIPKYLPGVICGKVAANGKTLIQGGKFSAEKTKKGEIKLSISGQSPESGVLIVSAEGGEQYNVDNIVSYQAVGDGWQIQSRDLPKMSLQDCRKNPMFSFAFFPFDVTKAALKGER